MINEQDTARFELIRGVVGSDVVAVYESEIAGTVSGAFLAKGGKRVKYLTIDIGDGKKLLALSAVKTLGDALLIGGKSVLEDYDYQSVADLIPLPIAHCGYTSDGAKLGSPTEIFCDNRGNLLSYSFGERNYPVETMLRIGANAILFCGNAKLSCTKPKPRKLTDLPHEGVRVKIMPIENAVGANSGETTSESDTHLVGTAETTDGALPTESVKEGATVDGGTAPLGKEKIQLLRLQPPSRVVSDYRFLLGRQTTKNIYSYSGELLAERGSVITAETVAKAQRTGKLIDLTTYSKP